METTPPPAPTVLRAVSLDFDDTLIESEAMKRAALVRVASAFAGGEAALGRIQTDSRTGAKVTRHTIFRDFCREVPAARAVGAEALVDRYSEAVREGIATAAELHGASRLLAELASEPACGSVNANPPSCLPLASGARNWLFWASLPNAAIGIQATELCTDMMVEQAPSPRAISSSASACDTWSAPPPP